MSKIYNEDDDIDIDIDFDIDDINHEHIEEKIKQASGAMFKKLMSMASIEDYVDDELVKKRIWCLRKQKSFVTHEDIDFYMNKATSDEVNARVVELTMELADA